MKSQPINHKCQLIYFCDLLIPKDNAVVLLKNWAVTIDHKKQVTGQEEITECSVEIFLYGSVAVIK